MIQLEHLGCIRQLQHLHHRRRVTRLVVCIRIRRAWLSIGRGETGRDDGFRGQFPQARTKSDEEELPTCQSESYTSDDEDEGIDHYGLCHGVKSTIVRFQNSTRCTMPSTILDGNHTFPPFYACYLLRSKAKPNSNRTYVCTPLGPADGRSDRRQTRLVGFVNTMES